MSFRFYANEIFQQLRLELSFQMILPGVPNLNVSSLQSSTILVLVIIGLQVFSFFKHDPKCTSPLLERVETGT